MADKPQSDGLKLSMLIQPKVSGAGVRPQVAQVGEGYSARPAESPSRFEGRPTSLRRARLGADLIDLAITVPIAVLIQFGLPFWLGWATREPDHANYTAVGLFMILIPYSLPLAALLYGILAYGVAGNSVGKRKMGLTVTTANAEAVSRKRLLLRPITNWGFFLTAAFVMLVSLTLVGVFLGRDQPFSNVVVALMLIFIIAVPVSIFLFQFGVRVFADSERPNLVDRWTGTRVRWKDDPAGGERLR